MKIVVIDGQGGKIGKALIEGIKALELNGKLYALGTNGIATSTMIKAGADFAATGENAIVVNSRDADIIIGPIGIVVADSLLGEITSSMAAAVGQSHGQKILLPVNRCSVHIVGTEERPTATIINQALTLIKEVYEELDKNCKCC